MFHQRRHVVGRFTSVASRHAAAETVNGKGHPPQRVHQDDQGQVKQDGGDGIHALQVTQAAWHPLQPGVEFGLRLRQRQRGLAMQVRWRTFHAGIQHHGGDGGTRFQRAFGRARLSGS
jgi:hypothetical protein